MLLPVALSAAARRPSDAELSKKREKRGEMAELKTTLAPLSHEWVSTLANSVVV